MNDSGEFIGVVLTIAVILGWVLNIVELAHSSHVTGMVILRAVGIFFFPLGGVLGYF